MCLSNQYAIKRIFMEKRKFLYTLNRRKVKVEDFKVQFFTNLTQIYYLVGIF